MDLLHPSRWEGGSWETTWASKPERETIMGSGALRVMHRILFTERPEPEIKAHATVLPRSKSGG